jgi:transcriptional regulator with XRE-family HTH domain
VDLNQLGAAFRSVRLQRNWSQAELARRANVSRWTIVQIENGRIRRICFDALERVGHALDGHVEIRFRWRGEELDRLVNSDHSAMHDHVARFFVGDPDWVTSAEVTFAIYSERGVIDILAFHRPTRRLLVIELKTLIVDVQALLASTDRYRRLATRVARDRGWDPIGVSVWVLVADTKTNRRRIAAHRTVLRTAFPTDGRTMRGWLKDPDHDVAALSAIRVTTATGGRILAGRKRASAKRRGRPTAAVRATSSGQMLAGRSLTQVDLVETGRMRGEPVS